MRAFIEGGQEGGRRMPQQKSVLTKIWRYGASNPPVQYVQIKTARWRAAKTMDKKVL